MEKSLFVVGGLSGSGKSVVAKMVADRTGSELLRTDVIRLGMPPDVREKRTTPEGIRAVYVAMMERARELLAGRDGVVLDGTFLQREQRALAMRLADETKAVLRLILVQCRDDVAEKRILKRAAEGTDASEAGVSVRKLQQGLYEAPGTDEPHESVDTSGSLEDVEREVERLLAM